MAGQPAERHGFRVGLPTELVLGQAIEHFAGAGHFLVELS
jgi:hypothetical protein